MLIEVPRYTMARKVAPDEVGELKSLYDEESEE